MRDAIIINFKKKDGIVSFKSKKDKENYNKFKEDALDKDEISMLMTRNSTIKSLKILAKVHVMIKEIDLEMGEAPSDVKKIVKDRAMLKNIFNEPKSFADCSSEELTLAIHECNKIFKFLNIKDWE